MEQQLSRRWQRRARNGVHQCGGVTICFLGMQRDLELQQCSTGMVIVEALDCSQDSLAEHRQDMGHDTH